MNNFFNTDDVKELYDVVIFGAGPAGCSAALYAARDDLSVIIFEKNYPGGNVAITDMVENYPGIDESISGSDLAQKFFSQATKHGAQVRYGICQKIDVDGLFKVITLEDGRRITAKSVIIATGSHPKRINVPGESKFIGRGISFCATCDGGFYKDKKVIVLGGGNSALEEGMYLTRFASEVTVIHRRDSFRASKIVQKRAFANDKMKFITDSTVSEILGDTKLTGVKIKNTKTGEESVINADGVFIFVGWDANTETFKDFIELTPDGFIKAGEDTQTNIPGIFAAGDVRKKDLMQIITAASDGAIAAKMAEKYIAEMGDNEG